MNAAPTVQIHGETIDQLFVQMVESALLAGCVFSHAGDVLSAPPAVNPDAVMLFQRQPLTTALALGWLAQHATARGLGHVLTNEWR